MNEPDLKLAGLKIWIHGRQFPDATDFWDGNWLPVSVLCQYPSARVEFDGPIIHFGEIEGFLRGLEDLYKNLKGKSALECTEPNLRLALHRQA